MGTVQLRRLLLLLALLPALAWGEVTTGGVNWLDPLGYTKPQFYPITVPTESGVTNKWYVDLSSGSGSACTIGSPCASLSVVAGKAGTTGGPAYIYVKGTGRLGAPSLYGSSGNEVVIRPWDDATQANFNGDRNDWVTNRVQHVVFDGGPNLRIKFTLTSADAFAPAIHLKHSTPGQHSNIKFYRTQWEVTDSGEWFSQYGAYDNLYFINSEFYATASTVGDAQHQMYMSGFDERGTSTGLFILNNIFRDTPGEAFEIRPFDDFSGITIDGNAWHNIGKGTCSVGWGCRSPITLGYGNGASMTGVTISNNLFFDTGEGAIRNWNGSPLIYNNTMYLWGQGTASNQYPAWAIHGYSTGSDLAQGTARNNIIYATGNTSNGFERVPFGNSAMTTSNNLCKSGASCGSSSQVYTAGTFLSLDPNNPDFMRLAAGSPAIGGATNVGLTTDYFGNSRPQGGTYDIGASEYNAGGPDTTPDAFSFTDQTNVALSTLTPSNTLTVSGIDSAATISVTGGEYRINAGSYTTSSGTINNGDTFQVRHTSSASFGATTNTVLTIGGVSDTFTTTTLAADTTPNAFTFTDQTNVPLNDVRTSNSITVLGINTSSAISVTGGTYSINGGAYTASAGSVVLNDTVTARHTSSASYSTAVNTAVTIGGVSDTFTSTTLAAPPPSDPVLGGFWWD